MLICIRGLPGSGKTTLAIELHHHWMVSADDFFIENGEYIFDPSRLGEVHAKCQNQARDLLKQGKLVVVHNTFSQRWELEPYIRIAAEQDVQLFIVDLFDGGLSDDSLFERNKHNVPLDTITRMRERWEHDWKAGDPRPPWER